MKFFVSMLLSLIVFQCSLADLSLAGQALPPLQVVKTFNVQKYLGKWYEIASIRHSFQKGCVATTATYSLRTNGKVNVLNECRKYTFDGKLDRARGTAWAPNPSEPAKLVVQFFWPFKGDYWVIELGENYEYAVVGHPSRDYLWILSRTPQMDARLYDDLMIRLKDVGYDLLRIERTPQPDSF